MTASAPPVSTCDLCDVHKSDTSGRFRVLPPQLQHFGGRRAFHGPVVTVKCFEDNTSVKALLESDGTVDSPAGRIGRVLVVDGGGSLRRAMVGGQIAAAAARNGWAGVVIDGCMRDRAELAACDVGLMALALIPLPTVRRAAGEVDGGIRVLGVDVRPGDWLYADEDGVVVAAGPMHAA